MTLSIYSSLLQSWYMKTYSDNVGIFKLITTLVRELEIITVFVFWEHPTLMYSTLLQHRQSLSRILRHSYCHREVKVVWNNREGAGVVWLTGEMEKDDSIDASEAGVSRVLYHERAKPRVWPLTVPQCLPRWVRKWGALLWIVMRGRE